MAIDEAPGYRYVAMRDGASKAVVTCRAFRYATAEVIPEENRQRG